MTGSSFLKDQLLDYSLDSDRLYSSNLAPFSSVISTKLLKGLNVIVLSIKGEISAATCRSSWGKRRSGPHISAIPKNTPKSTYRIKAKYLLCKCSPSYCITIFLRHFGATTVGIVWGTGTEAHTALLRCWGL